MLIQLLTAGSRGDVEPFLALAEAAVERGHRVRLAVTQEFADGARSAGHEVDVLQGDYEALVRAQGASVKTALLSYRSVIKPMLESIQRSAVRAIADVGPDVVVHHPKILTADIAATAVGSARIPVEIVPVLTRTTEYPAAGVIAHDLGWFNQWTFAAVAMGNLGLRAARTEARATLGLPRSGHLQPAAATLCPVSPSLLPVPADWPPDAHMTGAWFTPSSAEPNARIDAFLDGGEAVYAGFGSMATGDPVARARAVIAAARGAGLRTLIATGWGGLSVPRDALGEDIMVTAAVDHATVLPRVAAAIHHGGAGTVHAAARAGTVSIVVPFLADQPWWGALLERRQLSPATLPARRLNPSALTAALRQAARFRPATQALAEKMRHEHGTAAALDIIEGLSLHRKAAPGRP